MFPSVLRGIVKPEKRIPSLRFAAVGMTTKVVRLCNFSEAFFEVLFLFADVFDLLRAVGFALYADGAVVAGFAQAGEDFGEVHESRADQDLFAELVRVGGP